MHAAAEVECAPLGFPPRARRRLLRQVARERVAREGAAPSPSSRQKSGAALLHPPLHKVSESQPRVLVRGAPASECTGTCSTGTCWPVMGDIMNCTAALLVGSVCPGLPPTVNTRVSTLVRERGRGRGGEGGGERERERESFNSRTRARSPVRQDHRRASTPLGDAEYSI